MKNAMFKVAALSATLILLCVIVVAQNVIIPKVYMV